MFPVVSNEVGNACFNAIISQTSAVVRWSWEVATLCAFWSWKGGTHCNWSCEGATKWSWKGVTDGPGRGL